MISQKRKNFSLQRACSFIGSTNRATFLNDETGSVRWLCFELTGKIDFNYSHDIDIHKLWAQAHHLAYTDMDFCPELSVEDILENEERNKNYQEPTMEEELVTKYYETSEDPSDFMTASDVITQICCINPRLNIISIGKALTSKGFQRVKDPERKVYGYLARPLFHTSPWELS